MSVASERRKESESTESKVVASVQLDVTATSLALIVIQVPAPTARAPEVVVSPPPSRALNEAEAKLMLPPEIVSPESVESPPAPETEIPPENVDVAVEEELIPAPACRSPATESLAPMVEEAFAIRFWRRAVEEACNGEPATMSPEERVELAVAKSPPDWSTEKRVVVAPAPWRSRWIRKGEADWFCRVIKVRRLEVVVVATIVTWEEAATVVVPMPT